MTPNPTPSQNSSAKPQTVECDLMVVGCGMTGMSAALFAARRDLSTTICGMTGELIFASGYLDLLGVYPVEKGRMRMDPWQAAAQVAADCPDHPYARISLKDMRAAMDEVLAFLGEKGLSYHVDEEKNQWVITPAGTAKTTYAVCATMKNQVRAMAENQRCMLFDFNGLKGFSARQVAETLKEKWPALETKRLEFPGLKPNLLAQHMAMALEAPEGLKQLAQSILEHAKHAQCIGLPAILGVYRPMEVRQNLEKAVNLPVFEVPTMPPGVTGLRLKHVFETHLPNLGVRAFLQRKVLSADLKDPDAIQLEIGFRETETVVRAKTVVLATGRFLGKGLAGDQKTIRETVFDLPVFQPASRAGWLAEKFFDPKGHPINRAGIEVDPQMRPLGKNGKPAHPRLFAAGSILAHQDWKRMKCGAGLAVTTAFAAVNQCRRMVTES